jgi:hypothetical protein
MVCFFGGNRCSLLAHHVLSRRFWNLLRLRWLRWVWLFSENVNGLLSKSASATFTKAWSCKTTSRRCVIWVSEQIGYLQNSWTIPKSWGLMGLVGNCDSWPCYREPLLIRNENDDPHFLLPSAPMWRYETKIGFLHAGQLHSQFGFIGHLCPDKLLASSCNPRKLPLPQWNTVKEQEFKLTVYYVHMEDATIFLGKSCSTLFLIHGRRAARKPSEKCKCFPQRVMYAGSTLTSSNTPASGLRSLHPVRQSHWKNLRFESVSGPGKLCDRKPFATAKLISSISVLYSLHRFW